MKLKWRFRAESNQTDYEEAVRLQRFLREMWNKPLIAVVILLVVAAFTIDRLPTSFIWFGSGLATLGVALSWLAYWLSEYPLEKPRPLNGRKGVRTKRLEDFFDDIT